MLYQMLDNISKYKERKIQEKNQALLRKIKRLERKKQAMNGGGNGAQDYNEDEDDELVELED